MWPDLAEAIPVLAEAGELREVYGAWHWTGDTFPAGDFSLRATDGDRFKVVDRTRGVTLCEMTRPQVYREAHTRAIYLHAGVQYQVEALDLVAHVATVVPVEQNYYTQPDVRTHIEVLAIQERRPLEGARRPDAVACFGDVRVDESVVGYKMLEFHNHQNLGYEQLHQPLALALETEAVWWPIPEDVLQALGGESRDVLRGMAHAIGAVARLRTMAERSDLVATSFRYADTSGETRKAVVCYDTHPGGIGFAATAYDLADELLAAARRLVRDCACRAGCPACVGGFGLSREVVGWALDSLLVQRPRPETLMEARSEALPPGSTGAPPAPAPPRRPPLDIAWEALPARWNEVRERLADETAPGAPLLASVEAVDVRADTLVLLVDSAGLARWIAQDDARAQLSAVLASHLRLVQGGWRLSAEVVDGSPAARRRRHRLRHRLEDFRDGEPASERAANDRLASGFQLAGDRNYGDVPPPPAWPDGRTGGEPTVDPDGNATDGLRDGTV